MSKRRSERSKETPLTARNNKLPLVIFLATTVGALFALGMWNNRPPEDSAPAAEQSAKSAAPEAPVTKPAAAPNSKPGLQKLVGRWVRPDGGYVIQIAGVGEGGQLEAAYFNPNPIPVEKAEAKLEGEELQAVVVLGGQNYAGSTYTLNYEPTTDRLQGIYYQAVARQQFEVFFERTN